MFDINDIITTQSYKKCCDYIYEASTGLDNIPKSCIIYTSNDHISDLIKRVKGCGEKYIVVSSHSDFCLYEQQYNNPTDDLQRTFDIIKYQYPNIGYTGVQIPPNLNKEQCNPNHKFILKCERYSHSTFDDIPNEIKHIFIVNCCVNHPKITPIPFGILEDRAEKFANLERRGKTPKIYISLSDTTLERVKFKKELKRKMSYDKSWAKNIVFDEEGCEFDEYLEKLKQYIWVLSMEGNGVDCYRNLETIYSWGSPIYPYSLFSVYHQYGIYYYSVLEIINNMILNIDVYKQSYKSLDEGVMNRLDYTPFKLSYWNKQIKEKAKDIL